MFSFAHGRLYGAQTQAASGLIVVHRIAVREGRVYGASCSGCSIGVVSLGAFLAWRNRSSGRIAAPQLAPRELAESLEWREGDASPNGRRVLWVEPAARTLLSGSTSTAAFFAAGCPVDVDALALRLPEDANEISVSLALPGEDSVRLLLGYLPRVMEDKWRIVGLPHDKGMRIFFLRSWTGSLVYVLEVQKNEVRKLWAAKDDLLAEPMVRALVDGYLLGKPCVVPAPAALGEDRIKLMAYGIQWAGRHCSAVEPGVAPPTELQQHTQV